MSAGQISRRITFITLLIWSLIIRTALADPDPPHTLTAEAPIFGEITIEWLDDSDDEDSYILQVRTSPQADWSSLGSFNSESKDVTLTGGSPVTNYEFRILSVNESGQSASQAASIIMPDKFLNNPFANISQGKVFSLQLIANNQSKSQSITYKASPLPDGLSIDSRTGIISGTALEDGYFNVTLRAEYNSPEATASLARLALRIAPALSAPQLKETIPDIKMIVSESPVIINLNSYFQDKDTRLAIQINTNYGNMVFSLFDKTLPDPVSNFLKYVDRENYSNTIFHRSVNSQGLNIIQSGSYSLKDNKFISLPTDPPILNEPGIANDRGTLAFARTSDPNSATSGWYINTQDNPGLDVGNSYTVFGRTINNSLNIIDQIASFPTGSHEVVLNDTPYTLSDFPTTDGRTPSFNVTENVIIVKSIVRVPSITYEIISNTNPEIVQTTIEANHSSQRLTLKPLTIGSTQLDLSGTDIDGNKINSSINISVENNYEAWAISEGLGPDSNAMNDRPAKGLLNNLQSYAFGGKALDGNDDEERLPKIIFLDLNGEIRPSIKLFHRKFISDLNYSVQFSQDLKNWNAIWSTSDGKSSPLITDLKESGIFTEITILNPAKEGAKSQQFFRVLIDYIGAN
ncbi:MAG: hypothetical protein HN584_05750 [Akkermansiaceae bacterium]|jgi:peptidyl-prolyl cis-trans isomerase A (cyclophilin A)|nr:hypothetical protein [Akkermansiaceae bacterium]MDG1853481.1 peptidylprolyl isomerase [Verrucomicrobiales bacterium]